MVSSVVARWVVWIAGWLGKLGGWDSWVAGRGRGVSANIHIRVKEKASGEKAQGGSFYKTIPTRRQVEYVESKRALFEFAPCFLLTGTRARTRTSSADAQSHAPAVAEHAKSRGVSTARTPLPAA